MAVAQDAFNDLRRRLVLVDTKLQAATEQGQVRFEGDFVAGFIHGAGQAFEARDRTV
ncbi:hypothetical protein D3C71_1907380 [compost metagenome]